MRSALLLPALLATAALGLPSTAAAKDVTYHAEATASGTYELHQRREDPSVDEWWTADLTIEWNYLANYGGIVFRDGRLLSAGDDLSSEFGAVVTKAHFNHYYNHAAHAYDCPPGETVYGTGEHQLVETSPEVLGFRPADHFWVMASCDINQLSVFNGQVDLLTRGAMEPAPDQQPQPGFGAIDLRWYSPKEAIGSDYVEDLIEPTAEQLLGDRCPGHGDDTLSCKVAWKGNVKMWKDGETASPPPPPADDDLVVPLPPKPADDDLVVPLPPKPADDDLVVPLPVEGEDLIVPLPPEKALSAGAKTASFTASCPAGCTGTGTITAGVSGKGAVAAAAGRQPFRFTLKPGPAKRRVTIRLEPRVRRAVKRARGATVAVTVMPRGGKPVRRTLRLRLGRGR